MPSRVRAAQLKVLAGDAFSRKAFYVVALRSNESVPILVNLFNSSMVRFVKPGASRRDETCIVQGRRVLASSNTLI